MVRKPGSSYLTAKPIVPIVFFHMKKNDHPLNYIWRKTLARHLISMEEDSYYYAVRPSLVCRKTVMHINQREDRGRHQRDLIRNIVDYSIIETPVANPL